jgi:hypothetical protein
MVDLASHVGVAADWARLPVHLGGLLPGLVVVAKEELALGRRWSLQWRGHRFALAVHVHGASDDVALYPANVGGTRSKEQIGDILVELDSAPGVVWQFRNVLLDLQVRRQARAAGRAAGTAARAHVMQLARAVQLFLAASVVSDLRAVTPRLDIAMPAEHTVLLGVPLRLAFHAANIAPAERHLEIRSDGFEHVTWRAAEITATPARVGRAHLWLCLQNARTWLRSPHVALAFRSLRSAGRTPTRAQARYLSDAWIEQAGGWRLRFERDVQSDQRSVVFIVALGDRSVVAIQYRGPRYSNAPPNIAMKLHTALLLDGARAPVLLRAAELYLDNRRFPDIRGTISLGAEDWEIAAVSAGSPAERAWMEELQRLGLDIHAGHQAEC